jgi:hypothetical protein
MITLLTSGFIRDRSPLELSPRLAIPWCKILIATALGKVYIVQFS